MYIPPAFQEERLPVLHDLMRAFPFACLVTEVEGRPFATHLPFLIDSERGKHGTLRAHMARPNAQWRGFEAEREALVLFQGPHAYISPAWYESSPAVPTWNYAVAHAYGIPRIVDDQTLHNILEAMLEAFETSASSLALPDDYFKKMAGGVVGFEIEITRLEGKFKLSQNRSAADQRGVVEALRESTREADQQVAEWMVQALE